MIEIGKRGFSGGLVVRSLPANSGDAGSIPDPRRIPHAMGCLGPCATATEPVL